MHVGVPNQEGKQCGGLERLWAEPGHWEVMLKKGGGSQRCRTFHLKQGQVNQKWS